MHLIAKDGIFTETMLVLVTSVFSIRINSQGRMHFKRQYFQLLLSFLLKQNHIKIDSIL